jgi:type IV pilus assembly protein PilA
MGTQRGFSWIEMLTVIAVIGLLALMAVPSMQESIIRRQVKDAMALADVAKAGVQAAYTLTGEMPADNAAAGIPVADKIVSSLVREVRVQQGAITLTFGNNANKALVDKHLTLLPAVVPGEAMVPISWLCHDVPVPQKMEVRGTDQTDLPYTSLPVECRKPSTDK